MKPGIEAGELRRLPALIYNPVSAPGVTGVNLPVTEHTECVQCTCTCRMQFTIKATGLLQVKKVNLMTTLGRTTLI